MRWHSPIRLMFVSARRKAPHWGRYIWHWFLIGQWASELQWMAKNMNCTCVVLVSYQKRVISGDVRLIFFLLISIPSNTSAQSKIVRNLKYGSNKSGMWSSYVGFVGVFALPATNREIKCTSVFLPDTVLLSWSTTSSCHDIPVLFLFPKTVLQILSKRNPQRPSMYLSKDDVVKLRCGGPRGCGNNLRHIRSTLGVLSDCCYDSCLPETYFGTKGNNFTVLSSPHLIQTSAANPVSY